MSTTGDTAASKLDYRLLRPHEFEFGCAFDDPDEPSEVTVYSFDPEGGPTTQWITADVDDAVPVREVA